MTARKACINGIGECKEAHFDRLATPAIDLSAKVCSNRERGLTGIVVDPAFVRTRWIYVYYTFNKFGGCPTETDDTPNKPVNRLSRFELPDSNVINPLSETVLVDNIASPAGIHNSGDLHFAPDGTLFMSVGDGGCPDAAHCGAGNPNAQSLAQLNATNSTTRCGSPPAGFTNPIYDYKHEAGCSAIAGAAWVPDGLWPAPYSGSYLFADYACGKVFDWRPRAEAVSRPKTSSPASAPTPS